MSNLGQSMVFWVALLSGLTVLFVLPTIIAMVRDVPRLGLVVMFNLLGAVTGGAGWIGALVLALRLPRGGSLPCLTPPGRSPYHR